MHYSVRELPERSPKQLTFGQLDIGDLFVILDDSTVDQNSAIYKKIDDSLRKENTLVCLCMHPSQIGLKPETVYSQIVARIRGFNLELNLEKYRTG